MNRRMMIAGGAGALLASLLVTGASARIAGQGPVSEAGAPPVEEVKRGGRGRHLGWRRGRGKAWGRRRKFGF